MPPVVPCSPRVPPVALFLVTHHGEQVALPFKTVRWLFPFGATRRESRDRAIKRVGIRGL